MTSEPKPSDDNHNNSDSLATLASERAKRKESQKENSSWFVKNKWGVRGVATFVFIGNAIGTWVFIFANIFVFMLAMGVTGPITIILPAFGAFLMLLGSYFFNIKFILEYTEGKVPKDKHDDFPTTRWIGKFLGVLMGITFGAVFSMGLFGIGWPLGLSIGLTLCLGLPSILLEIYIMTKLVGDICHNIVKFFYKKYSKDYQQTLKLRALEKQLNNAEIDHEKLLKNEKEKYEAHIADEKDAAKHKYRKIIFNFLFGSLAGLALAGITVAAFPELPIALIISHTVPALGAVFTGPVLLAFAAAFMIFVTLSQLFVCISAFGNWYDEARRNVYKHNKDIDNNIAKIDDVAKKQELEKQKITILGKFFKFHWAKQIPLLLKSGSESLFSFITIMAAGMFLNSVGAGIPLGIIILAALTLALGQFINNYIQLYDHYDDGIKEFTAWFARAAISVTVAFAFGAACLLLGAGIIGIVAAATVGFLLATTIQWSQQTGEAAYVVKLENLEKQKNAKLTDILNTLGNRSFDDLTKEEKNSFIEQYKLDEEDEKLLQNLRDKKYRASNDLIPFSTLGAKFKSIAVNSFLHNLMPRTTGGKLIFAVGMLGLAVLLGVCAVTMPVVAPVFLASVLAKIVATSFLGVLFTCGMGYAAKSAEEKITNTIAINNDRKNTQDIELDTTKDNEGADTKPLLDDINKKSPALIVSKKQNFFIECMTYKHQARERHQDFAKPKGANC